MSTDLWRAVRTVEALGIAPLQRSAAARPRDFREASWAPFLARRTEIEAEVVRKLEEAGASIRRRPGITGIAFAGIRATSTRGLLGALSNWAARARPKRGASR